MKRAVVLSYILAISIVAYSQTVDYTGAVASFIPNCNYGSGRTTSIDTWVNHWIGTGTYAGAISWFHTCPGAGSGQRGYIPNTSTLLGPSSAHFVIRASDGQITQTVKVANTAYHCGASGYPFNNPRSIGVEHDATLANPGNWNSVPMLTSSTNMACYFTGLYSIPRARALPGIREHKEMPGTSTDCAGTIPWTTWMSMLNTSVSNGCSGGGCTPPSNNNCSSATTLTPSTSCNYQTFTTNCATQSIPATAPCNEFSNGNADDDVWFKFTATAGTNYTVQLLNGTNFDGVVEIRTGSCNGTSVACDDQSGSTGVLNQVSYTPSSNQTLYVRVYHYGAGSGGGNFQICVRESGGSCTPVSVTSHPSNQTVNVGGTTSFTVSVNGMPPFSYFWYKNGSFLTSTTNTSSTSNTYTTPSLSASNDGDCYHVLINNCNDMQQAQSNTACITVGSASSNPCNSIIPVNGCGASYLQNFTGTGSGAWNSNTCYDQSVGSEQIYSFTAPTTGTYSIQVNSANWEYVDYLWKSGSCSQSGWNCIDQISSPGQYGSMSWTAGTTYYILLDNEYYQNYNGIHTFYINCPSSSCTPPSQPGIISGNTSVSSGSSQTYSIGSVSGATSYTWSYSGGGNPSGSGTSVTLNPTSSGTLSVTANNACGISTPRTLSITVIAPPSCTSSSVILSTEFTNILATGGSGTFNITFTPASSGCQWSVSQNDCSWVTGLHPTTGQTAGGQISYTVLPNSGSSARTCTLKITAGNNVYDHIISQQGTGGGNCTITPPQIILENGCDLKIDNIPGATYQWYMSGDAIPGATSRFHTATVTGYYYVEVTDASCTVQSNDQHVSCSVGITNIAADLLNIYPNPSNGTFRIVGNVGDAGSAALAIFSPDGKQVYAERFNLTSNEIDHIVSLEGVAPGAYIIRLAVNSRTFHNTLVVY